MEFDYGTENNISTTSATILHSPNTTTVVSNVTMTVLMFTKPVEIFYYFAYSLMFILGTVGNCAVIYFIARKQREKKTNFDVYIISLSVADLLASFFLPMVMIHDLATEFHHWHLAGELGCKLLVPMPHINSLVSALMLVVISYDRLRIIRQTHLRKRSRMHPIIEVVVVWIISIIVVSPYMAVLHVDHGFCHDLWEEIDRFVYYAVLQGLSCFLPIIVMVITYALSAYILLHKKIPGESGRAMNRKRRKQNQKVTQMFGIIVVIFFVMTTPYMISFFIIAYYGTFQEEKYFDNEKLLFHLQYAFYTLMGFNASINPLIYAVRYKDLTKGVKKLFSTKKEQKKRKYGVTNFLERKYGVGLISESKRRILKESGQEESF